MKIIYIKETKTTCDFIKGIILKIKKFLNIIKVEVKNSNNIYYLPIFKDSKITKYRIKKLCKKINRLLEKDGTNVIALSENLNNNQLLKNYLFAENINILDGRYLFKCLTHRILEYIFKIKGKEIELGEISILINDFTEINKEIIIDTAKRIKRLNIITNHIEKCKRLQEYLYNEFGIMLNITNNKRKSLLKSEIILNMDFAEESINKYKIYDNAIIVNISDKILLKSKRFDGININYYKIQIPDEYKLEDFQNEIIYESLIYGKNYKYTNEKIIKDKIKISRLIGNNGTIKESEFV